MEELEIWTGSLDKRGRRFLHGTTRQPGFTAHTADTPATTGQLIQLSISTRSTPIRPLGASSYHPQSSLYLSLITLSFFCITTTLRPPPIRRCWNCRRQSANDRRRYVQLTTAPQFTLPRRTSTSASEKWRAQFQQHRHAAIRRIRYPARTGRRGDNLSSVAANQQDVLSCGRRFYIVHPRRL